MSAIKKIAAIVLAVTVVASSAAIFAGIAPAVELLASIEKEYGKHVVEVESNLVDVVVNGQARK
ncbi:hypothetical protein [Sporosarcina sp. UB5]|uniref:hypothetical protein n=1 Tax=Sporosarcina sp. UB5 TaxID=3047463 RepID=UPI003D7BE925